MKRLFKEEPAFSLEPSARSGREGDYRAGSVSDHEGPMTGGTVRQARGVGEAWEQIGTEAIPPHTCSPLRGRAKGTRPMASLPDMAQGFGSRDRIRTCDLAIMSRLLCR